MTRYTLALVVLVATGLSVSTSFSETTTGTTGSMKESREARAERIEQHQKRIRDIIAENRARVQQDGGQAVPAQDESGRGYLIRVGEGLTTHEATRLMDQLKYDGFDPKLKKNDSNHMLDVVLQFGEEFGDPAQQAAGTNTALASLLAKHYQFGTIRYGRLVETIRDADADASTTAPQTATSR